VSAETGARPSTPAAERLLNLLIALTNSRRGYTKAEIRARVAGYSPDAPEPAFNRLFERDKDLLREELGLPVETLGAEGVEARYRISAQAAQMPPIDLTAPEIGALGAAAAMWRDAALEEQAARALTRLRALGYRPAAALPTGFDARVPGADREVFARLVQAVSERQPVAFKYRTARTGLTGRRLVEPWRLRARGRAWYLAAWDRDRGAPRVFRLSRIEGSVTATGSAGAFDPPAPDDVTAAFAGLDPRAGLAQAVLAVAPGRAHSLRARAAEAAGQSAGADLIRLDYADAAGFARELAGLGDAVAVVDPPELRRDVIGRLQAALELSTRPLEADAEAALAQLASRLREGAGAGEAVEPARPRPAQRETTPARLARLLGLVAYLAGHGSASIRELARQFETTPAQIQADIDLLWVSGTPGYMPDDLLDFALDGEGGEEDQVTLVEDQAIGRPLRLAPAEAAALLAALGALAAQPGIGDMAAVVSAQAKLRAAMAAGGGVGAQAPAEAELALAPAPALAARLRDAIGRKRVVELDYVSGGDQRSRREVDPIRVFTDGEHWLLAAWDRAAGAARTFRLDRVLAATVGDEGAQPHPEVPSEAWNGAEGSPVTLLFAPGGRWIAEDLPPLLPPVELPGGGLAQVIAVRNPPWLRSLLLGQAPEVWAGAPDEVRRGIAQAAAAALDLYGRIDGASAQVAGVVGGGV
jgi:predicted DNA-binding transcriptional regulator YafY